MNDLPGWLVALVAVVFTLAAMTVVTLLWALVTVVSHLVAS